MTIGILSDTHDALDNIAAAVLLLNARGVDLAMHLGDWVAPFVPIYMTRLLPEPLQCPLKGIFGNNDGDQVLFLQVSAEKQTGVEIRRTVFSLDAGERRIIAYHGTDPEITEALVSCGYYDIVLTGHTHQAEVRQVGKVLHINPGSLSGIQAGRPGGASTFAIYDSTTHTAEIVAL